MATPLDDAMKKLDLSDAQLAEETGLARQQIWSIRRGKKTPLVDTAQKILDVLERHGVRLKAGDLSSLDSAA